MEHADNRAGSGTSEGRNSDGMHQREGQETPPANEGSIRPGMGCLETMLVARLNEGSYLLMSYSQGEPGAFVIGVRPGRRTKPGSASTRPSSTRTPGSSSGNPTSPETRVL